MGAFQPADSSQVRERFHLDLAFVDQVLEFVNHLGARLDGMNLGGMSRLQFFVLFQFVKAFKSTQAIRLLFLNGHAEDAEMLLRVLIEQAILLRWVHKSDERARAYALLLREKQFTILSKVREVMPDVDLSGVPVDDIEKGYEDYSALTKELKWRSLTGDIAGIAAEIGMKASYMFHMGGTDLIHSNPTRERCYVRNVRGKVHFNTVPCMPDGGLVLAIAAQHLLFIADVVNDAFGFETDDRLRALMAQVQQSRPS